MDLYQLGWFIHEEKEKLNDKIIAKAKELHLTDIIREIKIKDLNHETRNFQDGWSLNFVICEGNYTVNIYKNESVLQTCDCVIARFTGE